MKKLVFFLRHNYGKRTWKIVIILFIFSIIYLQAAGANEQVTDEEAFQVIPDEAIRLRILANSDQEVDQEAKRLVRDEVSEQISGWVEELDDIEEARELIKSRIPEIKKTAMRVLATYGEENVQVEYGENITFPVKLYDSYLYPAGEYEAVLITIGQGDGANWWCVLFPPLCFLDFSNGALVADSDDGGESEQTEELEINEEEPVKIKFFLFEWFGWT